MSYENLYGIYALNSLMGSFNICGVQHHTLLIEKCNPNARMIE